MCLIRALHTQKEGGRTMNSSSKTHVQYKNRGYHYDMKSQCFHNVWTDLCHNIGQAKPPEISNNSKFAPLSLTHKALNIVTDQMNTLQKLLFQLEVTIFLRKHPDLRSMCFAGTPANLGIVQFICHITICNLHIQYAQRICQQNRKSRC